MDAQKSTEERFDKLKSFYSEKFKFEYNVSIAGALVPLMASMRDRQQKTMMGISVQGLGPEAGENVFFLFEEKFDAGVMEKVKEILLAAEKEYVNPNPDHAFTFLSAVVFVNEIDKGAEKALKRFKLRWDYRKDGWIESRIAVFGQGGAGYCSKDGSNLKRMLEKIMESK